MTEHIVWIVSGLGAGTLAGVFWKMKQGFGPMNLRIVGLVLIVVLAAVLATSTPEALNASIGLLGAVAGYLFGAKATTGDSNESSVDATGASIGANVRMAGRDINETLNNITAKVDTLGDLVRGEIAKFELLAQSSQISGHGVDLILNTIYERDLAAQAIAVGAVVHRWTSEGWKFRGLSSDFQGMDGIYLVFEQPAQRRTPKVRVYHGSDMEQIDPSA